jgi:hypothetical protein
MVEHTLSDDAFRAPVALFCDAIFEERPQRCICVELDDLSVQAKFNAKELLHDPCEDVSIPNQTQTCTWNLEGSSGDLVKVGATKQKQVGDGLRHHFLTTRLLRQESQLVYHR